MRIQVSVCTQRSPGSTGGRSRGSRTPPGPAAGGAPTGAAPPRARPPIARHSIVPTLNQRFQILRTSKTVRNTFKHKENCTRANARAQTAAHKAPPPAHEDVRTHTHTHIGMVSHTHGRARTPRHGGRSPRLGRRTAQRHRLPRTFHRAGEPVTGRES